VKQYLDHEVEWTDYDPGVDGIDRLPKGKFHLIVSSDVMEHIEPDHLNDVLEWLTHHATKFQYHLIACSPDLGPPLPDGRNAHLIVQTPEWWREQFQDRGIMEYWSHEEVLKRDSFYAPYCCIQLAY
jgi:hypothetical protein